VPGYLIIVTFCTVMTRFSFAKTGLVESTQTDFFFHCSDGQIRQACCDSPVLTNLSNSQRIWVQVVIDVSCPKMSMPMSTWHENGEDKTIKKVNPVKFISTVGRDKIDNVHSNMFYKFPVTRKAMTINNLNTPPGAGPGKQVARSWSKKKVLVIVSIKVTQESFMQERKDCLHDTVKTLDALY